MSPSQDDPVQAPDLEPPLAERRPKRRRRVLLRGVIVYAGGQRSFDCTIRDLSETGARIVVPANTQVPTNFHLINVRDKIVHDAKMVWCGAKEAGVSFTSTVALSDGLDPALAYLKRIWLARATA